MKLVYLLVVLSNGDPIRQDPIYFAKLKHCTVTAKKLNYQGRKNYDYRNRHPVRSHCEPRWVRLSVKTF